MRLSFSSWRRSSLGAPGDSDSAAGGRSSVLAAADMRWNADTDGVLDRSGPLARGASRDGDKAPALPCKRAVLATGRCRVRGVSGSGARGLRRVESGDVAVSFGATPPARPTAPLGEL